MSEDKILKTLWTFLKRIHFLERAFLALSVIVIYIAGYYEYEYGWDKQTMQQLFFFATLTFIASVVIVHVSSHSNFWRDCLFAALLLILGMLNTEAYLYFYIAIAASIALSTYHYLKNKK